MRFKAMVEQPVSIIRMLTALSHMTKDCLIVLCPEHWKIMINEKFVPSSHPQCYASIPIAHIFSHYMLESQSNDEILLQINVKNLLAAFKSVKEFNAGMTILKLTKKNNMALLSFEMWQDDGNELRVNVIQDVSVKPIQHSKLYLYEEPTLGAYHASSNLPPIKSLKTVIERMRIINSSVSRENAMLYIDNNDGRFLLEIKTEHCALKTIYQNLSVNNQQLHQDQSQRNSTVGAKIDLKYLLKVVQALQPLQIKQTVIAITKKTCVTIHARLMDYGLSNDADTQQTDEAVSSRITFYLCVYIDDDEISDDEEDDDADDENEDGKSREPEENDQEIDLQLSGMSE